MSDLPDGRRGSQTFFVICDVLLGISLGLIAYGVIDGPAVNLIWLAAWGTALLWFICGAIVLGVDPDAPSNGRNLPRAVVWFSRIAVVAGLSLAGSVVVLVIACFGLVFIAAAERRRHLMAVGRWQEG